jgi:hypothetical protein
MGCRGSRYWGANMPSLLDKMRAEAMHKRRLAESARRLSGMMHQPAVSRDLATQASVLEQLAADLEECLRQRNGSDEGGDATPVIAGGPIN